MTGISALGTQLYVVVWVKCVDLTVPIGHAFVPDAATVGWHAWGAGTDAFRLSTGSQFCLRAITKLFRQALADFISLRLMLRPSAEVIDQVGAA